MKLPAILVLCCLGVGAYAECATLQVAAQVCTTDSVQITHAPYKGRSQLVELELSAFQAEPITGVVVGFEAVHYPNAESLSTWMTDHSNKLLEDENTELGTWAETRHRGAKMGYIKVRHSEKAAGDTLHIIAGIEVEGGIVYAAATTRKNVSEETISKAFQDVLSAIYPVGGS